MKLPLLDRLDEWARLRRLLQWPEGSLGVLYGRRRCGKSRLLQEALAGRPTVYCHADERESTLREWKPASAWWGGGLDRSPLEIDVASESVGGSALLLGEVEWAERSDPQRLALELSGKSEKFPLSRGRNVYLSLWIKKRGSRQVREAVVQGPAEVLPVL